MPIEPVTSQSWLFVPPLTLPLALRVENGRFGARRPKLLPDVPPCATTQLIDAGDPGNPTGADVYYVNQLHEAVDLAASAGDCVFAAYSGRLVELAPGAVTIDHHPRGLGFVTKYNHVTDILFGDGDFIQKGMPFAAVSAVPTEPHLHFELWAVVERDTSDASWPGDSDLVPVDPTRALYDWERRTAADQELAGGPLPSQSIGVVQIHAVPFFSATFATETLYVPMYEPMTADERLIIDLLRDAHRDNVSVTLRYRSSSFWGVDVITHVEL